MYICPDLCHPATFTLVQSGKRPAMGIMNVGGLMILESGYKSLNGLHIAASSSIDRHSFVLRTLFSS